MNRLSFLLLITLLVFTTTSVFAQEAAITIEHELGTVVVPKNPRNVVVFDYGILDILRVFDVEVQGLPQASLPDYLEEFRSKDYVDVGTLFEPNFERIYELNPDLIIISGRQGPVFAELNRIAPTLYVTIDQEDYLGSLKSNLRLMGEIFSKEDLINQEILNLEKAVEEIHTKAQVSELSTLFLMVSEGTLNVYGPGSRFGMIHNEFGLLPADPKIEKANHGQNVSFEYLLKINPDLLLVLDRNAVVGGSVNAQQVLNVGLVRMTKAFENDKIFYLDAPAWYVATGGIDATWQMIEDLNSALTP